MRADQTHTPPRSEAGSHRCPRSFHDAFLGWGTFRQACPSRFSCGPDSAYRIMPTSWRVPGRLSGESVAHYVYFHRDPGGKVFYVGKGTGDRAWSRQRHPAWQKYVAEHLNGQYTVELHTDGLSEEQAERLEWDLISQLGEQLVNWINPGRQFDYAAIALYHKLRDANREFVAETKPLEVSDPQAAVQRYRQALLAMREYESITRERGIVAQLNVGPTWGDPGVLDRLTLCLIRIGRPHEAVLEADSYFARFPSALKLTAGRRITARVNRYRGKPGGSGDDAT